MIIPPAEVTTNEVKPASTGRPPPTVDPVPRPSPKKASVWQLVDLMERETGFEPATLSLGKRNKAKE